MKRMNLDQNEINALEQFEASGMNAVAVIKKIFNFHIAELDSIKNIDPKGNMGLQSLANQNALEAVEGIRDTVFQTVAQKKKVPIAEPEKTKSQWR